MTDVDVLVVGAGFAGLYMLHRLRSIGVSAQVVDTAGGVGGTWWWNRYPGARCDIQSMEYSYSFDGDLQREWIWTERFASQAEILAYLDHVADRFDLRRDITFDTKVTRAHWDSPSSWVVSTTGGTWRARFLVMATGCLSVPNAPPTPGVDDFEGRVLHTGTWPHEPVDFTGERVAVIGTGSSGIQSIPMIADQAEHLTVFQRTPNYSVPARNRHLGDEERRDITNRYDQFRAANRLATAAFGSDNPPQVVGDGGVPTSERNAEFERRWQRGGLEFMRSFDDVAIDPAANATAADFLRGKIRALIDDPGTAASLMPETTVGCKRLCVDTDYFATYNRGNVELIDLRSDPLKTITESGLKTEERTFEVDSIVLATGFDAMTGAIMAIDPIGDDGQQITEAWVDGPTNYLGLAVPKFPNMFMITGPGSPSVLTNMVVSIEQHVEWVADLIAYMDSNSHATVEATTNSAADWVEHVNTIADFTLFTQCNSWYLGANIEGKPRQYMPLIGFPDYAKRCDVIAAEGYPGFEFGNG